MEIEEVEEELKEIYGHLYGMAYAKLKNREDTEDVLSETKYIVLKEYKKLRDKKKFKAWVSTILNNECYKVFEQNKKDKELIDKAKYDDEVYDNLFDDQEGRNEFENLIKRLNVDEKEIFKLYFYENLTLQEISEIINTSNNTVKSRFRRGKEKIKRFINNSSKRIAIIILISIICTSGIAIARTIISNMFKNMNTYSVYYNKDQIDNLDYNIDKNKVVIRVDFSNDYINKDNFDLYWKNNPIYLMNINRNKNVIYSDNYKWIEDDVLEITFFCEYKDLGPNLTLHIVSNEEKSITILLKK